MNASRMVRRLGTPDNQTIATTALLVGGIIGGLGPFTSKVALRELPPLTILFLRICVMVVCLLPFVWRSHRQLRAQWKKVLLVGLLWTGNVALFIIGIQYTTTIASQLLYTAVPIVVLMENYFVNQEKLSIFQKIGIPLGFVGALLILLKQESIAVGLGTLYGNAIILVAASSWASYLVVSKRVSLHMSSVEMTFASALVAGIVVGPLMLAREGLGGLAKLPILSLGGWFALLFIAFGVGLAMIFLYQVGVKRGTAIVAATVGYLGLCITAVTGVLYLGEKITPMLIAGSLFIVTGVFLTSTLPLFVKKRTGTL